MKAEAQKTATSAPESLGNSSEDRMVLPSTSHLGFMNKAPAMPVSKNNNMLEIVTDKQVMDPNEIRFWQAEKGQSLKAILDIWAGQAGVDIVWGSAFDYKLPQAIRTHGTFPDAITEILTAYTDIEPRPFGRLHPNLPYGPSVLIVESYPATN